MCLAPAFDCEKNDARQQQRGGRRHRAAKFYGLTLMADHTFLFHPAVFKPGKLVRASALAQVTFADLLDAILGVAVPEILGELPSEN